MFKLVRPILSASSTSNCELPSDKYYGNLDSVTNVQDFKHYCDLDDKLHNKCYELKDFCWKWESNLNILTKKNLSNFNMEKHCTYLNLWLQYNVINTVESKKVLVCITYLYSIWENIQTNLEDSIKMSCVMKFPPVSTGYREILKKIHDYNNNYEELKSAFQNKKDCKENCIEGYCKYIADIINIYNKYKHLFFFGSKIDPKSDDMRKMWRNVQEVTNPASLLNPMKPPGGENKIGLPFLPK
ncbi:PIR Superfamily Protein [Plasmodium ovale wallikeri]|uniref:PIR Superfamily Protein n=1 Tax=Plasmodium ovale wallikeri TaxID=864142 RepID=A0A1A9AJ72_PLAOA|nr:PIR Superfamily Protein [Plasmodium ovale wallikeri]